MVFMHLLRYVLGLQNMKPWDKFDLKDYKTNVRAVSRYTKLDKEIIQRSAMFEKLPEKVGEGVPQPPGVVHQHPTRVRAIPGSP